MMNSQKPLVIYLKSIRREVSSDQKETTIRYESNPNVDQIVGYLFIWLYYSKTCNSSIRFYLFQYKDSLTSTTTTTPKPITTATTTKSSSIDQKTYPGRPNKKISKYSNRFSPTIRPFKRHKFGLSKSSSTTRETINDDVRIKTTTTAPLQTYTSSTYR